MAEGAAGFRQQALGRGLRSTEYSTDRSRHSCRGRCATAHTKQARGQRTGMHGGPLLAAQRSRTGADRASVSVFSSFFFFLLFLTFVFHCCSKSRIPITPVEHTTAQSVRRGIHAWSLVTCGSPFVASTLVISRRGTSDTFARKQAWGEDRPSARARHSHTAARATDFRRCSRYISLHSSRSRSQPRCCIQASVGGRSSRAVVHVVVVVLGRRRRRKERIGEKEKGGGLHSDIGRPVERVGCVAGSPAI